MAKDGDRGARRPPGDLLGGVQEFFEGVAQIRLPDGTQFRTPSMKRPSHVQALTALGLVESSYSGWKTGDPRRDETFNRHLADGLRGDLDWVVSSAKATAKNTWEAAQRDPSIAELIPKLSSGLDAHGRRLAEVTTAGRRAAGQTARQALTPMPGDVDATPADFRWSDPWIRRIIEPWTRGLAKGKDRVVYIYGARGSGKNVLTTALGAGLVAARVGAVRIHLNVRDLVAHFRIHQDAAALHAEIIREISGRSNGSMMLSPNFDDEMTRALGRAGDGAIYLFIENADACLRIDEKDLRAKAIEATAPLFNFLRPVAQESGKPILDRTSVVLEGSRPLGDLAKAYPASPLNDGRPYVLRRLSSNDCAELGRLAGIDKREDLDRLYAQTAGHRSLVWAVLKSVGSEVGPALPLQLADLDLVTTVAGKLREDLQAQPGLAEAFARARRGERIDREARTRLRDLMYVDDADPPACGCPLLEALLEEEA